MSEILWSANGGRLMITKQHLLAIISNAKEQELIDAKKQYRDEVSEIKTHFRDLRKNADSYCSSVCPKCGAEMQINEGCTYLHMLCKADITHSDAIALE